MQSSAGTVEEYLAGLAEDRRAAIAAVRQTILDNLDSGYAEGMSYGMIGYFVPHAIFPAGYHCDPRDPLPFAGLASQKNHMAVYLMGLYLDAEGAEQEWFRQRWAHSGKRLDLGKSCLRFKRLADVDLPTIGEAVRRMPTDRYIALYEAGRRGRK